MPALARRAMAGGLGLVHASEKELRRPAGFRGATACDACGTLAHAQLDPQGPARTAAIQAELGHPGEHPWAGRYRMRGGFLSTFWNLASQLGRHGWLAWFACIPAMGAGCTALPSGSIAIQTEAIGGQMTEYRAIPLDQSDHGPWYRVVSGPARAPLAYIGMEGSPVFDGSGRLIGHVAESKTGVGGGVVRIGDVATAGADRASMAELLAERTVPLPGAATIVPGHSVGIVSYRGDSMLLVAIGSVAAVEGDMVRCRLTDISWATISELDSDRLYGLVRAPVLGFGIANGQAFKICAIGELVGTIYAGDRDGQSGVLGIAPRGTRVEVKYTLGDVEVVSYGSEAFAGHPGEESLVVRCVKDLLGLIIIPQGASALVSTGVNGREAGSAEIAGGFASKWRASVCEEVGRALREDPAFVSELTVSIRVTEQP